MTATRSIISNALLECLTISLDTESGSINLKDYGLSQKGAIVRVLTIYETSSTGNALDIQQDGAVVLVLDDADGVFTSKNDLFNRPGFVYSTDDVLTLVYNVTQAVTVKIYYALNPQM